MASTYQIIKFVKLDMPDVWTLNSISAGFAKYISAKECQFTVVSEGDSGLWSYVFSVPKETTIYVLNDIVHIPSKYVKKENANWF